MSLSIDERLEASMADYFWAPDDVSVVDRPELGFAYNDRPSPLFNCVFRTRPRLAEPSLLLDEVLEHHSATSRWIVNALSDDPALIAALENSGYAATDRHDGYAIQVDAYDRAPGPDVEVKRVTDMATLRDLYQAHSCAFDVRTNPSAADLERELKSCAPPDARVARFVAYIDGVAVGAAGLTNHTRLDFGFLWAGGVVEEYRGRGAYTALLRARLDWAKRKSLTYVGLYAKLDTSAPIVAAHGFERHGFMQYWDRL